MCQRRGEERAEPGGALGPATFNPHPYFPDEKTEVQEISDRIRLRIQVTKLVKRERNLEKR